MKSKLQWWVEMLLAHNGRLLQILQWDLIIESDASLLGLGASFNGTNTDGPWTLVERLHHINYLVLMAAFLVLKSFITSRKPKSVLRRMDNLTAIAFLIQMGGTHSLPLLELAVEVWEWCIHAKHLPGVENV